MESRYSLPHSQQPATCTYPVNTKPAHTVLS